jgi:hypothetical protein
VPTHVAKRQRGFRGYQRVESTAYDGEDRRRAK